VLSFHNDSLTWNWKENWCEQVGESKNWSSRYYCCHGLCNSNTTDAIGNVKMLPFPKPCALFHQTLINADNKHNIKSCAQCLKCTRWMHLCRRADAKFASLVDISTKTYARSIFFDNSGPTLDHPDPFPANNSPNTVVSDLIYNYAVNFEAASLFRRPNLT
jgi:hypothetical protein